jgi:hypothetical protein
MLNVTYLEALSRYYPEIQVEVQCNDENGIIYYDDIIWKVGGPVPQNELEAKILELAKERRTAEISQDCENHIMSGFVSDALGTPYIYDSEFVDQVDLVGALITVSPYDGDTGGYTIYYACRDVSTGVKNYHVHTYHNLRKVIFDSSQFKLENLQIFHMKRVMISLCDTIEQVDEITWTSPWF